MSRPPLLALEQTLLRDEKSPWRFAWHTCLYCLLIRSGKPVLSAPRVLWKSSRSELGLNPCSCHCLPIKAWKICILRIQCTFQCVTMSLSVIDTMARTKHKNSSA